MNKMESPMDKSDSSSSEPDILHPELLSKDKIVKLLQERQIKVDNKDDPDKSYLVELFHRTVMPLPQRVPRNNRRGKRTKALIRKMDAKKPKREETTIEYQNPKKTSQPKRGLLISSDINLTPGSRLKPPLVVINRKKTIIKLNSSSSGSSKPLDNKVTAIRTAVSNMKLASSSSQGTNCDTKKLEKQANTQESQQSGKSVRKKITYSDSSSDVKKNQPPPPSSPETKQGGLLISLSDSTKYSPPSKSVRHQPIKTNRSHITLSDGSKSMGSSRLSVAASGKDAILKALGAPNQEREKGKRPTEKSPVKRPLDSELKKNDVSDRKKRKITWP